MKILILMTLILVGCGKGDDGNNASTNNATNNGTNNLDERNVPTTDCEDACIMRAGDCEASFNPAVNWCQASVCFRLISQRELDCVRTVSCPEITNAIEERIFICDIADNTSEE